MQIVIDIPEEIYNTIQDDMFISREQLAVLQQHIFNGTPLPKGHGRLISADSLIERCKEYCKSNCPYTEKQRDIMCYACNMGSAIEMLEDAPTVIAAEKEEE